MMMVASSSDTCTTGFVYSRIPQSDEVRKDTLTEEDPVRKEASIASCQNSPSPTKRGITFAPKLQILCTVPHRKDCSREEIKNRWFGKEEYSALIWESSVTLTMLKCDKKKGLVDDTLLCSRGLLDTQTLLRRQQERSCINKLVLLELKETGDEVAAAELYHEISQIVLERAREKAIEDEEFARKYASEIGSSEQNHGRGQHSQADNRTEIERMILRELEESDNLNETDKKLMRGLKRLNKRKDREAEQARQRQDMRLMQRLQQLADLFNNPSLTPEQRAAVEQAANQLVQGSSYNAEPSNNEQTNNPNPSDNVQNFQQKDDDISENPPKRQRIMGE